MLPEIKAISFGGVNCYLATTAIDFILIDTGYFKNRTEIEKELKKSGLHARNAEAYLVDS